MTKRAKRLAKYLQEDLGWVVFDETTTCSKCNARVYGKPYCSDCGKKQIPEKDDKRYTLNKIEKAIKFALMED